MNRYIRIYGINGIREQLEHRWIMEKNIGRKLSSDEVVHHINKDITDNRLENLELTTKSKYSKKHMKKGDLYHYSFSDKDRKKSNITRKRYNDGINVLCLCCKKIKPKTKFYQEKRRWDGLNEKCKECFEKYRRKYARHTRTYNISN